MSINIQNLINRINNKVSALDSNSDLTEITRLNDLSNRISGDINEGAVRYRSSGQLPSTSLSDSAYDGQIAFVEDQQLDSNGRYFFRTKNGWINLNTLTDSDEDVLIASSASSFTGVARQGSTSGYAMGNMPYANNYVNKYSLTSDGNATDVLDLSLNRGHVGGNAGPTHGYATGGSNPTDTARIDKFPFASDDNATDVGGLTAGRQYVGSSSGDTHGYTNGGGPTESDIIDKFAFASDGDATDVGNLVQATKELANGMLNSLTDGYAAGGRTPTYLNTVGKFPFATDTDASSIPGTLTSGRRDASASSSSTHGYVAGGQASPGNTNIIDKFSFATDGDATDVGDLSAVRIYNSGVSSTTHGYSQGGFPPVTNVIEKYSFTSDGNATDVGDLNATNYGTGGTQS